MAYMSLRSKKLHKIWVLISTFKQIFPSKCVIHQTNIVYSIFYKILEDCEFPAHKIVIIHQNKEKKVKTKLAYVYINTSCIEKKSYFLWSKSPFHWIEVVTRNKSRMSESISEDSLSNKNLPTKYKMYPIRWLVLLTIFLFNLSNNLLWISFSAVSTKGNIRLVSYDTNDILST